MPETKVQTEPQPPSLSAQAAAYRHEAINLIAQGIEHPRFEVKRSCPISGSLHKRAAFVKVIQGLANAEMKEERLFLIGADNREKRFFTVDNLAQYDQAKIGDLLRGVLEPMPEFTAFPFETDAGEKFILIAVAAQQPRPIVCVAYLADSEGKPSLRPGEIWIKENTALRPALRSDFELMIKTRMDMESESRAKMRFSEFLAATDLGRAISERPTIPLPQKDLIFGSDAAFRQFVGGLIATSDGSRFRMLVELFRDELIEAWHPMGAFRITAHSIGLEAKAVEYIKNSFLPALHRLGQLALLVCKFGGPAEWFGAVLTLLNETHATAADLEGFAYSTGPSLQRRVGTLSARTARTVAAYVMKRGRYDFLSSCLRLYSRAKKNDLVRPLLFDWFNQTVTNDPRKVGLGEEIWDEMGNWMAPFFGSIQDVNAAFAQLEFVLEFNSFLEQGTTDFNPPAKAWFASQPKTKSLLYISAIWRLDLRLTEPLALLLTHALKTKNLPVLKQFAIEPGSFEYILTAFPDDPREVLRQYLKYLRDEQGQFYLRANRFPPDFDWSDELKREIN